MHVYGVYFFSYYKVIFSLNETTATLQWHCLLALLLWFLYCIYLPLQFCFVAVVWSLCCYQAESKQKDIDKTGFKNLEKKLNRVWQNEKGREKIKFYTKNKINL